MLRARGLTFRFPGTPQPVLCSIDLDVPTGGSTALMGPSGSGKSTLLRILAGLVERDGGEILLDGCSLPPAANRSARRGWHRRVLLLPQDTARAFNPARRLGGQFRAAMELHGVAQGAACDGRAADMLDRCGVAPAVLDRYPDALSGGQRQRAALARLLCLQPRMILLDEPTAALDPATTIELLDLLAALRVEHGFGMLTATHDPAVAAQAQTSTRL